MSDVPAQAGHAATALRLRQLGTDRFDHLAFAHEILALHDHARAVGDAGDPHEAARPRPPSTGTNPTLPSRIDRRTPRSPLDEKVSAERGTRVAGTGASGTETSAVMPSGIAPSAFGQLDLDPIGARRLARGLGDEADPALGGLAGDQPHLGRLADLDAGELALGHFDDREHRIERDEVGELRACEGERRLADFDRHVADDAVPGRADDAALALGLGGGKRRFGGLELRFEIDKLEPRHGARRDQAALGFELGRASASPALAPAPPGPRAPRRTGRR